jgi:ketosteroid isomerase-like protein
VAFVVQRPFPEPAAIMGREAIREYMREFVAQYEPGSLTFEATSFRSLGESVVVEVLQRGRGRASGAATDLRFLMLWMFRGRSIVRIESVPNEPEALEAAGLTTADGLSG